jgi:hypothetical protein
MIFVPLGCLEQTPHFPATHKVLFFADFVHKKREAFSRVFNVHTIDLHQKNLGNAFGLIEDLSKSRRIHFIFTL